MSIKFMGAKVISESEQAPQFKKGDIWPIVGWNNGLHVIYEDKYGNPIPYCVHNFGFLQNPEQDGPTFEMIEVAEV